VWVHPLTEHVDSIEANDQHKDQIRRLWYCETGCLDDGAAGVLSEDGGSCGPRSSPDSTQRSGTRERHSHTVEEFTIARTELVVSRLAFDCAMLGFAGDSSDSFASRMKDLVWTEINRV
jgi:hypothetical protein